MERAKGFQPAVSAVRNGAVDVWDRRFLLLLFLLLAWRVIFLAVVPLDLSPDEAYYWDWSRVLDWGYYSKPPLIAWINALSTGVLGATEFAVRVPAAILGTTSLFFLYRLARRMFDSRTAFWAVAAGVASLGHSTASFIMTIDSPLLWCWAAALYTFWRAREREEGGLRWWILTGVLVGIGSLAKQMMLTFPLLMVLFFLLPSGDRSMMRRYGPWLAIAIGLAFLLPVVYWNMEHEWITFQHTTHHFEGHHRAGLYFLRTFSDFLGSQAALISPVTWFLFFVVSIFSLVRWTRLAEAVRFAVLFGAFPFLFFVLFSFRQRIYGNWPAVCYFSGMIMLSAWYTGFFAGGHKMARLRGLFVPGVALGAFLAFLAYALLFVLPYTSLGGTAMDPLKRLRGWKEMGLELDRVVSSMPQPGRIFLVASKRELASELAFYMANHPRVYLWRSPGSAVRSQYDLWPGPKDQTGKDCLIVLGQGEKPDPALVSSFRSVSHLATIEGKRGGWTVEIFRGECMLQWPS